MTLTRSVIFGQTISQIFWNNIFEIPWHLYFFTFVAHRLGLARQCTPRDYHCNLCLLLQVQQDTAESMSCVVELDRVKSRMISTERRLKQADKWCVLNDQIDTLFEEQVNSHLLSTVAIIKIQNSSYLLTLIRIIMFHQFNNTSNWNLSLEPPLLNKTPSPQ